MAIMTEKELAKSLGISPWTIRNWRLNARLPYFGTAGRIFYRKEAVDEWMKQEEQKNVRHSTHVAEEATF